MDIQLLGKDSLRIKSKKTAVAIDPKSSIAKFDADAILLIDKKSDVSRVNDSRITIDGAGEYEISGLKVSGIKSDKDIMYGLNSENVDAIVAKASSLETVPIDKIGEYQVVIINVDSDLKQSVVTAMEPRVVVLYGEKAKEGAKVLGKESVLTASKISIAEEKLPEEMDVMLLG
jgi:hypothetical protein